MTSGVLRDPRADAAYFAALPDHLSLYIEGDERRLAKPDEAWKVGIEFRGTAAQMALTPRWKRFTALYSAGADVETLRAEFSGVLSAAERAVEFMKRDVPDDKRARIFAIGQSGRDRFLDKDHYRGWLWLVSLAIVFGVDDETFDRVVAASEFGWEDRLLGRLIAARRPEHPVGEELMLPRVVGALDKAFDAASPTAAEKAVAQYLSKWYPAWKGVSGWGGHEFVAKKKYFGYWAFEAVAVAAVLGLDDSSFRDDEYYPRDLAGDEES